VLLELMLVLLVWGMVRGLQRKRGAHTASSRSSSSPYGGHGRGRGRGRSGRRPGADEGSGRAGKGGCAGSADAVGVRTGVAGVAGVVGVWAGVRVGSSNRRASVDVGVMTRGAAVIVGSSVPEGGRAGVRLAKTVAILVLGLLVVMLVLLLLLLVGPRAARSCRRRRGLPLFALLPLCRHEDGVEGRELGPVHLCDVKGHRSRSPSRF